VREIDRSFTATAAAAAVPPLASMVPASTGAVYVLSVLRAYRELPIDRAELEAAWRTLAGGVALPAFGDYNVLAGRLGQPPTLSRTHDRPFRTKTEIGSLDIEVRMESWLPTDTIRRSGFGHVIARRHHVLSVDRGVSLVILSESGRPLLTEYRAGLFAPVTRLIAGSTDTPPPTCYR